MKLLISSIIIALASWLAGKKPALAGLIVSLPLISMLSILFAYGEHRDMLKIQQFAMSILVAVPLSLTFFIPFVLHKWIKFNFPVTYLSGVLLLILFYYIHSIIFKS